MLIRSTRVINYILKLKELTFYFFTFKKKCMFFICFPFHLGNFFIMKISSFISIGFYFGYWFSFYFQKNVLQTVSLSFFVNICAIIFHHQNSCQIRISTYHIYILISKFSTSTSTGLILIVLWYALLYILIAYFNLQICIFFDIEVLIFKFILYRLFFNNFIDVLQNLVPVSTQILMAGNLIYLKFFEKHLSL